MSSDENVDCGRRRLLVATAAVGGVAGVAAAVPFVASMTPSERAKSAGAPVEADISKLAPGQMMTVEWRGKPVWIIHRTPEQLESLKKTDDLVSDPKSEKNQQPEYCQNEGRSIKPEYMVVVGICTHLGCVPSGQKMGVARGEFNGWLCPCHGSHYDTSGRIRKGPAPKNLSVPPYAFLSDTKIKIG